MAVGTRARNGREVVEVIVNPLDMEQNVVVDELVRIRRVIEENQMPGIRSDKNVALVVRGSLIKQPPDFGCSLYRVIVGFRIIYGITSRHLRIREHVYAKIDVGHDFARFRVYLHNVGIAEQKNRIRIFVEARPVRAFQ